MTTNHHEDIFSSVTSRGAALWRSFSSSKMKQVQYETSMKNIPLGGNKEYVMQLTKSVRKVVYAMSWAAFIFLNDIQCEKKETYGFRSQKTMPMVEELKELIQK